MAGTLTLSAKTIGVHVDRYVYDWASDDSGDVNDTNTQLIEGILENVSFVPGSGGSQPSANYDVTIKDEQDIDILGGRGVNLSNSTASRIKPAVAMHDGTTAHVGAVVVADSLEIVVANTGDTKSGTIILYVRK